MTKLTPFTPKRIALIGSGPSALMAASLLSKNGGDKFDISIYEKRSSLGRKLLIAGSSGLNVSHDAPLNEFSRNYSGFSPDFWTSLLDAFGPRDWLNFIEQDLQHQTFLGTSSRYFVKEMKSATLLKSWIEYLRVRGVTITPKKELTGIICHPQKIELQFNSVETDSFDYVVLALGGGSWESTTPLWPKLLHSLGVKINPFEPSNVGYEWEMPEAFFAECEGKPLKNISLAGEKGTKKGELMITRYGLEGTPIYFLGQPGTLFLDLKPDLSASETLSRLKKETENLSPIRRIKKTLKLSEEALAVLYHQKQVSLESLSLDSLAALIKRLPIKLLKPRPLIESISSRGGVDISELNPDLSLKVNSRIFCVGEMIDWDAPTGGFLIQACISQGAFVARELGLRLAP